MAKVIKESRKIGVTLYINRALWFAFLSLCKANGLAGYRALEVCIQTVLERHGITVDEGEGPYAPDGKERHLLEGSNLQTGGAGADSLASE